MTRTTNALTAALYLVDILTAPPGRHPREWAGRLAWVRRNARSIRAELDALRAALPPRDFRLDALGELADDLVELHEGNDTSLDGWVAAREFVEAYHGPITPNGA